MRGSLWRRWDLHIHTPCSFHQRFKIPDEEKEYYGNDVWEKYIEELENVPKNVKVIGITDYFLIEGYKKVLDYQKKGRLQNFDRIFPNIEFRLEQVGAMVKNLIIM